MGKILNISPESTAAENYNDYDIIYEVLNGNINAFEILVKKYEKMIYNLALSKLGSHENAQDLTQECFLRAYRRLRSYNRVNAAFSTWIYILCRNLIYDFCKATKNRQYLEVSLYISNNGEEFTEIEITDISGEPSEIIIRAERIQKIREAIDSLPENHRNIIIMRDINGLSYNKIAELLNINVGIVKTRISRARRKLKKYILESSAYRELI